MFGWQQEVAVALFTSAIIGLFTWCRRQERKIDAMWQTIGIGSGNGLKRSVADLEEWKEDLRAELPKMLELNRHKVINYLSPRITRLERRYERT